MKPRSQIELTDEQKLAAWQNLAKMSEMQDFSIQPKRSSACERFLHFAKFGFFAGGLVGVVTTGGMSAVVQGAVVGAVSGGVSSLVADCRNKNQHRK